MKSQKSKVPPSLKLWRSSKSRNFNTKLKTIQYGEKKFLVIDHLNGQNQEVQLNVNRGEKLTYLLLSFDNSGEKKISVALTGENAFAQILGIIINRSDQLIIQTLQHHQATNTTSELLLKSVLFGKSRLDFKGLIRIEEKGQKSSAYQRNDNLLLSKQAKVDTKPQLEILTNDVRCTHGATISKIDDEILFYLMSRGITQEKAQRLIIEGFFEPVFERIWEEIRVGP